MKRQRDIIKRTCSETGTSRQWNLVLAAVAGVALSAVGCSTNHHARADYSYSKSTYTASTEPARRPTQPPPAAGAAETPGGRSSGYSPTPTMTHRTPGRLPPTSVMFVDRPVNFDHLRVERVVNDREVEVSSEDGSHFYVVCDQTTANILPGDIVFVSSTIHDPNTVSTAIDKKGAYSLTRHKKYWIQVDRLTIGQR